MEEGKEKDANGGNDCFLETSTQVSWGPSREEEGL